MRARNRKPLDVDLHRGTGRALQKAYGSPSSAAPHVGADAAAADFAKLLEQLNDPPQAYQGAKL